MRPTRPLLAALALLALPALAAPAAGIDPDLLAGLAARSLGPATMSGRIAAIDAAPGDPARVWVGSASGGLWRSEDGALTFEPVFDDQPVASIGAVTVAPSSPDVVWVGTGEGNPRNSVSVGDGVYRSLDGGATWTHLGLDESERIPRIVVARDDPDTAWVCALGKAWGDSPERGVFSTHDGGATWTKVLYVDAGTGCADLVADPADPGTLYAAMWDYRRWPWFFRSGGPGSGLFVSRDGGAHWRRLTPEDGLPEGDLGRIGLAVAPSRPGTVYALVEAQDNAFYRSTDGGRTWTKRSSDLKAGSRPFYFANLEVDPADPDRVYSQWSMMSVSDDGGATWRVLVPYRGVHPDHHALWIDPADPRHLLDGNDGGVYESRDHGASWRFVADLPLAQYYHVRVDAATPYHVYGGLQDNGSWKGPAEVWENGGLRNYHWQEVGFGDGFDTAPIPGDPERGYSMSQEGHLMRWDLTTGERKIIRPAPAPGGRELRFNWNAALALDPFDPDTVYLGSQFVHRSRDRGDTWEVISPDLTSDNPDWQHQDESGGMTVDASGAENYTTLVALAPSPVERGVLWAGSDDGRLHVSRDGGEHWERLDPRVHGVPAGSWIPHIEASPHDAATAFVVFDNHRRSDPAPYVVRTDDFGRTWKSLATPALRGYALVIRQDPVDPDLLFLGTELGLWLSDDGGAHWLRWTHGIPTVAVRDLAIQAAESDLVVATHGRGLFVIDDISPLRHLAAATLAEPLHLFPFADAQQFRVAQTGSSRFPGQGEFRGENEPYGALVTFSLAGDDLPWADDERERARKEETRRSERERRAGERAALAAEEGGGLAARAAAGLPPPQPSAAPATAAQAAEEKPAAAAAGGEKKPGEEGPKAVVEVRDAAGERIRRFEVPVHRGVNRAVWDLRRDRFAEPATEDEDEGFGDSGGPSVLPGDYTVTVRFGDAEAQGPVRVLADPRFTIPDADRRAKRDAVLRAGALQEALTGAVERLRRTRTDVQTVVDRATAASDEAERTGGEDADSEALAADGKALLEGIDAAERRLWVPPDTEGIPPETDAWSKVRRASWFLASSWDAPTPAQQRYLEIAEAAVRDALDATNRFDAERVAPFRERVRQRSIGLLADEEPLAMP